MIYRGTKLSCSRLFGSTVSISLFQLIFSLMYYAQSSCMSPVQPTDRKGRRGWTWRPIKPPRESLGLYKWFNPLWSVRFGLRLTMSSISPSICYITTITPLLILRTTDLVHYIFYCKYPPLQLVSTKNLK